MQLPTLNNPLKTPILFLVFNRLNTTKLVFEQIKLAKPTRLYIAADGPRSNKEGEDKIVAETRNWVIENITWECTYTTLFREQNLGCGKAVSSAIDWFFENEEMGIILEDDCLTDISFFSYCEELLNRYKEDTRVASICSSNTIDKGINTGDSYFFSKYCLIWGWATWRRAWKYYDFKMEDWPELKKTSWLSSINKSPIFKIYWTYIFDLCYEGKINTWDYQWIDACWRQQGLSIVPSVNLVRNIGIGNNSTHQVDERFSSFKEQRMEFPLKHPDSVKIFNKADVFLARNIFTVPWFAYFGILLMKLKAFKSLNELRKRLLKR